MSIINDALKKVQQNINVTHNSNIPNKDIPPTGISSSPKSSNRGPNWFLVKLLILFAFIILLIPTNIDGISKIINNINQTKQKKTAKTQSPTPNTSLSTINTDTNNQPAPSPPIAPMPTPATPSIDLQGIMAIDNNKYLALISGDVFEEGTVAFGWTIESITKTDVTIRKNDEVQTITIIGK